MLYSVHLTELLNVTGIIKLKCYSEIDLFMLVYVGMPFFLARTVAMDARMRNRVSV